MEQLVLDPPSPNLRLVVSREAALRNPRYRVECDLGADARSVYRSVLEWSLAEAAGRPRIDPDALRVVLAVRQARQPGPANRLTVDGVWQLMMVDIVAWCRARRLDVPAGCAAALLTLVHALDDLDRLHPNSDRRDELELALDECTGGWIAVEPGSPASPRW